MFHASTDTNGSASTRVFSLLRRYTAEFVTSHPRQAAPQVRSTLAKLELCRTDAMGGHKYRCDPCDFECRVNNSCGDRHCPQCAGAKRADWLDSTSQLLLPGITYFQVVFTIPDKLSSLALCNREEMYDLLFRAAWKTLKTVIADEQLFEAAAVMVLHTWNQMLEAHAHLHAMVPGGGPSLTGDRRWVKSRRPVGKGVRTQLPERPAGCCAQLSPDPVSNYLCDSEELKSKFRENFLTGLRRLHASGELKLNGDYEFLQNKAAFDDWLAPMETITWVAYIEPPPYENCPPEQMAKYLARYLTGGPISDRRIVSHENGFVTFLARVGKTTGGSDEVAPIKLRGEEFVRRWSLHILPKGYTKTRRFGGYWNGRRKEYIAECRELLAANGVATVLSEPVVPNLEAPAAEPESDTTPCCPKCQAKMRWIGFEEKQSWRILMYGPHRPTWYRDD